MKVALLTTQTPHHTYFASQIASKGHELLLVCETTSINFKYETTHEYEIVRDRYEKDFWFNGKEVDLSDFGEVLSVDNINSHKVTDALRSFNADMVFSFGTRKINSDVLSSMKGSAYNFHGGDPQKYRGLDSHLWALWHSDLTGLQTCLHSLTRELDDGDIFDVLPLPIPKLKKIEDIRILNTENCVVLADQIIELFEKGKIVKLKKQENKGRYYSAMPLELKNIVVAKFKKFRKLGYFGAR